MHNFDNFISMAGVVLVIGLCHPFQFDFDYLDSPDETAIGFQMPVDFWGSYTTYSSHCNCSDLNGIRDDNTIAGA